MKNKLITLMSLSLFIAFPAFAHVDVLTDATLLRAVGIPAVREDSSLGIAHARLTPREEVMLSAKAHEWGRCGGYETLATQDAADIDSAMLGLRQVEHKNLLFELAQFQLTPLAQKNSAIEQAITKVSEQNLRDTVTWLSSFPNRYNKSDKPNIHVTALQERLEKMLAQAAYPVSIELIDHKSTPQKSVHVQLTGRTRPNELVVLGAHLDSINGSFGGDRSIAPGADDNASGSSNLIETLRVLLGEAQPERSIEFFWYAGEESGLLGSAEIARAYKGQNRDVIGVLQLDMTLHPGDGEFTTGSMTDYTSAWLRTYFASLNDLYIGGKIVEDRCGYGCSDHASWYRQGYPTLMPFESGFNGMNPNIHTKNDVINSKSSFRHSAMFSKIGVAFAMDLANSTARSP